MEVINIIFFFVSLVVFSFYYILVKEVDRVNSPLSKKDTFAKFDNFILFIILMLFWLIFIGFFSYIYIFIIYFYIFYYGLMLNKKNLFSTTIFLTIMITFYILNIHLFNVNSYLNYFYGIQIIEPLLLFLVFKLTTTYIDNPAKNATLNIIFISVLILFNISFLTYFDLINTSFDNIYYYSYIIYFFIYILIQVLIIFNINKIYSIYFDREQNYQKSQFQYFKPYLNLFIHSKIQQIKISHGFIFIIDFNKKDEVILSEYHFHSLLQETIKLHYPKALFFMWDFKTYACFIPIEDLKSINLQVIFDGNHTWNRQEDDFLYPLEQTINAFEDSYKINLFGSIYGIESTELKDLFKLNSFLKQNEFRISYFNHIMIYNHRLYHHYLAEKTSLISLFQNYKINYKIYEERIGNMVYIFNYYDSDINLNVAQINILNRFLFKKQLDYFTNNYSGGRLKAKIVINLNFLWLKENYDYFIERIFEQFSAKNTIIVGFNLNDINLNSKQNLVFFDSLKTFFEINIIDFDTKYIKNVINLSPKYISPTTKNKLSKTKTKLKNEKEILIKSVIII